MSYENKDKQAPRRLRLRLIEGFIVVLAVLVTGVFLLDKLAENDDTAERLALAEDYANRAEAAMNRGEYSAAIDLYTAAIEHAPQNAGYYNDRGIAYSDTEQYTAAIEDFTTSLALGNDDPHLPYNNRGVAYDDMGNIEAALADYTRSIEAKNDYDTAYYNRALIYANNGDYERALVDYTKSLEYDPTDRETLNNRAIVYENLGQLDQALADYTRAIELYPDYTLAYRNRGSVYADKGDYARSLDDLNQAIELEPANPRAFNLRGITYRHLENYDQAIADYTQAIELGYDPLEYPYSNRAYVYDILREYDRAIADYERALDHAPAYETALLGLFNIYNDRGEAATGAEYMQEWMKLHRGTPLSVPHDNDSVMLTLERDNVMVLSIEGSAGETLDITASNHPDNESNIDPALLLMIGDDPLIAADDITRNDLNARLLVELPEDGVYSLAVMLSTGGADEGKVVIRLNSGE